MPPYATTADFREALLDARVLVPAGSDGLYHRSGDFERVLRGLEAHIASHRVDPAAPILHFPPVIAVETLLRTDYLRSSPDLVGAVRVFTGGDPEHRAVLEALDAGEDWSVGLTPADVMLSSATCHPVYELVGSVAPADAFRAECLGFAFRHEPSLDPMRMQSFRMYEFVLVGTPAQAVAHREEWLARAVALLSGLGLPVRVEVAHDPFFGRAGKMLVANQLGAELKFEVLVDVTAERSTAISSGNYHEDHFGQTFGIETADGRAAHGACFAFGLERITLALFAHHGLDPEQWPHEIKESLGV